MPRLRGRPVQRSGSRRDERRRLQQRSPSLPQSRDAYLTRVAIAKWMDDGCLPDATYQRDLEHYRALYACLPPREREMQLALAGFQSETNITDEELRMEQARQVGFRSNLVTSTRIEVRGSNVTGNGDIAKPLHINVNNASDLQSIQNYVSPASISVYQQMEELEAGEGVPAANQPSPAMTGGQPAAAVVQPFLMWPVSKLDSASPR